MHDPRKKKEKPTGNQIVCDAGSFPSILKKCDGKLAGRLPRADSQRCVPGRRLCYCVQGLRGVPAAELVHLFLCWELSWGDVMRRRYS